MDFIKNNQKLKIIPDEVKGINSGVVKEVNPLYFTVHLDNPNTDLPSIGENIEVIIPLDNCLVRFDTKIAEVNANIVKFSAPEKCRYVQRREYTRVNVNIPVNLKENSDSESINSITQNLSGGGMQILSSKNFDTGNLLEANFSILNRSNITTLLEILRTNDYDNNSKEYSLSGEFKQISNIDRTAIIQLCFKRQLETKCKEVKTD